MHVLIVGGTRFVGHLLTLALVARGDRVTLFNRGTIEDPFGDCVERLRGDRTTNAFDQALMGRPFDAVVDFAAYVGSDVERVVRTLGGAIGHYVFVSSGQVYLVRERTRETASEEDYEGPLMARPSAADDLAEWEYGIGKRSCEDALVAATKFPSTRLRIPMVHGARDYYRRLERYLVRLVDGGPVLVPDGGSHLVRHVYGPEVVRAILRVLGDDSTFGQAYNIAQHETPTLRALIEMLAVHVGSRAAILDVPSATLRAAGLDPQVLSPLSSPWMSMIDPDRARRDLAFHHAPLTVYLGKIVASFLAAPPDFANYAATRAIERRLKSCR